MPSIAIKPKKVDDVFLAFPANVSDMLHQPTDPKATHSYWDRFAARWFYEGADTGSLVAKPGVDKTDALRHLQACLRSYEPKHEHKMEGVAYMMSLWFELPPDAS